MPVKVGMIGQNAEIYTVIRSPFSRSEIVHLAFVQLFTYLWLWTCLARRFSRIAPIFRIMARFRLVQRLERGWRPKRFFILNVLGLMFFLFAFLLCVFFLWIPYVAVKGVHFEKDWFSYEIFEFLIWIFNPILSSVFCMFGIVQSHEMLNFMFSDELKKSN